MASVYLDSCVVIYLMEGPSELHDSVARAIAGGAASIRVSELTRLECRVRPMRDGDEPLLAQYDRFFSLPSVVRVPMTTEVFETATSLRAAHGIRTPDALHLATAIAGGCDELWTNDERLARAAGEHIRTRAPFE
jgi:predicted nucleic acid-binding protein